MLGGGINKFDITFVVDGNHAFTDGINNHFGLIGYLI